MAKKEDKRFTYILLALGVFAAFLFFGNYQPFAVRTVETSDDALSYESDSLSPSEVDLAQQPPQQQPIGILPPACSSPRSIMPALGGSLSPFPAYGYDLRSRSLGASAYHVVHNVPFTRTNNQIETEDSGPDLTFNTADDRRRLALNRLLQQSPSSPVVHGRWAMYGIGSQTLPPPYPQIVTRPLIAHGFGIDGIPLTTPDDGPILLSPTHNSLDQDDKDVASNNQPSDSAVYLASATGGNISAPDLIVYHQAGPNLKFDGWAPPTDDVIALISHIRSYSSAPIGMFKTSWSGKFVVYFQKVGLTGGFFVFYDVGPNGVYNGGPNQGDDKEYIWPVIDPRDDPYVVTVDLSPDGRRLAFVESYFRQESVFVLDIGPNGRIDPFLVGDDSNSLIYSSQRPYDRLLPRIDGFDPVTGQTSRLAYWDVFGNFHFVAANADGRYGPWPQPNGRNDDTTHTTTLTPVPYQSTLRIIRNKITFEDSAGINEISCI